MAILLMDGFDPYNGVGTLTGARTKWVIWGSSGATGMTTGRFSSGQAIRFDQGGVGATEALARTFAAQSTLSGGFAIKQNTAFAAHVFWLYSGSTPMVGLFLNSNGALTAGRYTALTTATTVGSSSPVNTIVNGAWHYITWEVVISDTVGVFNVYVDSVQVISASAADTRNGTPTTVDTIAIGNSNLVPSTFQIDFDDLYVSDTSSTPGERRIETLYPTSDIAQGWSRSTGSANFSLVDEATVNGDTDYVFASALNTVDTYGFGDLSATPTNIDAVQMNTFAYKTDATARSIGLQVISGGTTSTGPDYSMTASYAKQERLLLTDPDTSAAWTASAVNALQGGPKVTV
jgi:hypothetical protein